MGARGTSTPGKAKCRKAKNAKRKDSVIFMPSGREKGRKFSTNPAEGYEPPFTPPDSVHTTPSHRRDDDERSGNGRPRSRARRIVKRSSWPLDKTCCPCSRFCKCSADPRADCECRNAGRKCDSSCHAYNCCNQQPDPPTSPAEQTPAAPAAGTTTPPPKGGQPTRAEPVCQRSCCESRDPPP